MAVSASGSSAEVTALTIIPASSSGPRPQTSDARPRGMDATAAIIMWAATMTPTEVAVAPCAAA
jgi:hypothetical protein